MCESGTTTTLRLTVPAAMSATGAAREKDCKVDTCIAPIVAALNAGGVSTVGSCCGHDVAPGSVLLGDGREVLITRGASVSRFRARLVERQAAFHQRNDRRGRDLIARVLEELDAALAAAPGDEGEAP